MQLVDGVSEYLPGWQGAQAVFASSLPTWHQVSVQVVDANSLPAWHQDSKQMFPSSFG